MRTAEVDAVDVPELTDLVNRVYAVAEDGIWMPHTPRTNEQELAEAVAEGQMAVAYVGGSVAGVVRIQELARDKGEVGMLATDFEHRGGGVGAALVSTRRTGRWPAAAR